MLEALGDTERKEVGRERTKHRTEPGTDQGTKTAHVAEHMTRHGTKYGTKTVRRRRLSESLEALGDTGRKEVGRDRTNHMTEHGTGHRTNHGTDQRTKTAHGTKHATKHGTDTVHKKRLSESLEAMGDTRCNEVRRDMTEHRTEH